MLIFVYCNQGLSGRNRDVKISAHAHSVAHAQKRQGSDRFPGSDRTQKYCQLLTFYLSKVIPQYLIRVFRYLEHQFAPQSPGSWYSFARSSSVDKIKKNCT